MHLGLDPMDRKRHQPNTFVGVKALHSLHQAYVTLLNQVGLCQAITGVAAGDVHHETEMRQDQLPR